MAPDDCRHSPTRVATGSASEGARRDSSSRTIIQITHARCSLALCSRDSTHLKDGRQRNSLSGLSYASSYTHFESMPANGLLGTVQGQHTLLNEEVRKKMLKGLSFGEYRNL